jgi:large subunit ribosomal protein L25
MGFSLKGEKREIFGKNDSRRIRKQGKLPAVLYGAQTETIPLILEKKDVFDILKSDSGENTIFKISFDSETRNAMIKELQRDPVTDEILHTDLVQIDMDRTVKVSVPIVLVGDAVGVKSEGGFVDFATRELELECLPKDIPENIEVDISELHLHQSLKVEELTPPEGVTFDSDPGTVIVLIQVPTKEEEVVVEEEEIEGEEEAEEGAEPKEEAEEEKKEKEQEKKE